MPHIKNHRGDQTVAGPFRRYGLPVATTAAGYGALIGMAATGGSLPLGLAAYGVGAAGSMIGLAKYKQTQHPKDSTE